MVAGIGATTLQGAASGDVLFGATADGSVQLAESGEEILAAGASATTLAGGPGTSVQFAGTGRDVFEVGGGGVDEIVGFKAADHLATMQGQTTVGSQQGSWGLTLALSDGTTVVLFGLTVTPSA